MAIIVKDEDGIITELNILGINWAKVLCFKTTGLVSMGVMVPSCIGYVYWTGKTGKILEVALISFWGTFFPFWFACRYNYNNQKFQVAQMIRTVREVGLRKGTPEDIRNRIPDYTVDSETSIR